MPDLLKSLQGRDLGHLRIVAELWGVPLDAPDARQALQRLLPSLLERPRLEAVVEALPSEARVALEDLVNSDENRLPWALFARRYGALREMGPAKRDRDRPYLSPVSPAEVLWYRALICRAFFDTPTGPEEFAYIPEDLMKLLPVTAPAPGAPLGRPALPAERAHPLLASDRLLDHATTLMAALRLGMPLDQVHLFTPAWEDPPFPQAPPPLTPEIVKDLVTAAGLVDADGMPNLEPARQFLEAPRGEALLVLARAWLGSAAFNDLRRVPTLRAEGEWENDPRVARSALLRFLADIAASPEPGGRPFWSLSAFLQAVQQEHPDFQRPAGDYDSYFLRDAASGEFLRGVAHWEMVDAALLRYLIAGPLHWLGITDLAFTAPPEESEARLAAFRYSSWANALLNDQAPEGLPLEEAQAHIGSDFRLALPRLAPRGVRYQLARFSEWDAEKADGYHYHLTPASLARARTQGLTANHLLALLRKQARSVPPSLVKAIERWERKGSEARFEQVVVLRLSSPDLLQALRASRAARFLGDPLGPTVVIVRPGAAEKVLAVLAEMGYLGEAELDRGAITRNDTSEHEK